MVNEQSASARLQKNTCLILGKMRMSLMGIRMQGNPKSSGLTYVETGVSNFCFEVLITESTYHIHKLQVSESAAG